MFRLISIFVFLSLSAGFAFAQSQIPADGCPTISVTGPAGITIPGEVATFTASIEGERPDNIEYLWTAINGEIVSGQGTLSVRVRMPKNMNSTLTVTIELVGLPKTCPNSASESAPLDCICAAILIDEFDIKASKIDEIRLRNSLRTNKLDPDDQLYVIEYFPPAVSTGAIRRRQNKLRAFLAKEIGRDIASVTIVTTEAVTDKASMKVYRVPPGAPNPAP